jgi:hypothetical protein
MRVLVLLFAASLVAASVCAQDGLGQSPALDSPDHFNLPVSLPKIKAALMEVQMPLLSLSTLEEHPTFRVAILERQRIDELVASMDFKTTRAQAGGLYWEEVWRQMWPSVDNPLVQPYAAYSQSELLTIATEVVAGSYVIHEASNALRKYVRANAESAAREEVQQAIVGFCVAQPDHGAGIQICSTSPASR